MPSEYQSVSGDELSSLPETPTAPDAPPLPLTFRPPTGRHDVPSSSSPFWWSRPV